METKIKTLQRVGRASYAAERSTKTAKKTDYYSVRFSLRPTEAAEVNPETLRSLLVGIRIKCQHTVVLPLVDLRSNEYSRVVVESADWNQEKQRAGGDVWVNEVIAAYKDRVREVYDRQAQHCKNLRVRLLPNSFSVAYELKYGMQPVVVNGAWVYAKQAGPLWSSKKGRRHTPPPEYPRTELSESTLLPEAFAQYITMLRERTGALALSPITLGRWERALLLLNTFVLHSGQPGPVASKVSVGWARRFHAWMQTDSTKDYNLRPIALFQANCFMSKLREVLQWVYEEDMAVKNPLVGVQWPRAYKDTRKPILFLEENQVRLLAQTQWDGPLEVMQWWFLLMCYTGLDYADAVDYAQNRHRFEQHGPAGWKIVGNRKKPPHNTYYVPLQPEVLTLFDKYPEGPYDYCLNSFNLHTPEIEKLLGIEWRITTKTARKTFGNLMLARGYRIADVSRMLGHSTIAMTERHYVRVGETHIDSAMLRVQGASLDQSTIYLKAA